MMSENTENNRNSTVMPLEDNGKSAAGYASGKPNGALANVRRSKFSTVLRFLPMLPVFLLGGIVGLYFQPPGLQSFFRMTGLEPGGGTDFPIAHAIEQVREQKELSLVAEGDVVALGRVIPKDDVITLAMPFGAGDARVSEITVSSADVVTENDVIAYLDNRDALQAALSAANSDVDVQSASLNQARANVAANRKEAEASLNRAQATSVEASASLSRNKKLLDKGVISRAAYDTAYARASEAARDVDRNQITLSRYQSPEEEQADIILANAKLVSAQVQRQKAETDLEKSVVRAPISGTVLSVNVRAGERPGNEGIVNLGNTDVMTVEAEVYQSLIGRVAVGDPATVIAEAFDRTLNGVVTAIGLEIGKQTITSADPAANTDARVVDVIVTLDEQSTEIASRFTNLEAVVRIDAGRKE